MARKFLSFQVCKYPAKQDRKSVGIKGLSTITMTGCTRKGIAVLFYSTAKTDLTGAS